MGSESGSDHQRHDPRAVLENADYQRVHGRIGENRTFGAEGTLDPAVLVRSQGLPL